MQVPWGNLGACSAEFRLLRLLQIAAPATFGMSSEKVVPFRNVEHDPPGAASYATTRATAVCARLRSRAMARKQATTPAVGPYLGQWPPAAARGLAGRAYLRHLVRSMSAIALHSFDFRTNAIQADENAGAAAAARICGTPVRAQVVTPLT
jgi:hypothetical protein